MTPEALANMHALAMTEVPKPWGEQAFAQLLATPSVFLITVPSAFALGRSVLDETELLTLAVDPSVQRTGVGTKLLADFEQTALRHGSSRAFLEVATTNDAAKSLYVKSGWSKDGLRKGYYRANGTFIDAVLMSKALSPAS